MGREISGSVFDIKRFAVHDGPGLRTTVFFKGCPLSCLSCQNPEGQRIGPELLFRIDRCTRCGDCVPACPNESISLVDGKLHLDPDRCRIAGACVEACLPGALEIIGAARSVKEILDIVERDRIFYDQSGGGVTFSGGEPFAQPDFLRELLLGCRQRDLPVVLDTCGHVAPATFQELASLASGLLFDLKLMDEERHEAFSGASNRWILENLAWSARESRDGGPALTVRLPLVPTVNDDEENLQETAAVLSRLEGPPPADILPYHLLGVDKYGRLGRQYALTETAPPSEETLRRAVRILEGAGLTVTVRGEPYGHH